MKILHIPKTGGTAIKSSLIDGYRRHPQGQKYLKTKIKNLYICDHSQKLDNKDDYIFFVRDPIERFVSHFVFLKTHAIGYDTSTYFQNLEIDDNILNQYDTINNLASDIFNHDLKFKLIKKMSDTLTSAENIGKCKSHIFYVGTMEHLEIDFIYLLKLLHAEEPFTLSKEYANRRPSELDYKTELTNRSMFNLRKYLDEDYEIMKSLWECGLITKKYFNEINYDL